MKSKRTYVELVLVRWFKPDESETIEPDDVASILWGENVNDWGLFAVQFTNDNVPIKRVEIPISKSVAETEKNAKEVLKNLIRPV